VNLENCLLKKDTRLLLEADLGSWKPQIEVHRKEKVLLLVSTSSFLLNSVSIRMSDNPQHSTISLLAKWCSQVLHMHISFFPVDLGRSMNFLKWFTILKLAKCVRCRSYLWGESIGNLS